MRHARLACKRPPERKIVSQIDPPCEHFLTDPQTGKRIPRKQQPGYYPGYSTLSQKKWWDATTRGLIENRVNQVPPIRFFTSEELPGIRAICDRILPQDDRLPESRIPILNYLDQRLFE